MTSSSSPLKKHSLLHDIFSAYPMSEAKNLRRLAKDGLSFFEEISSLSHLYLYCLSGIVPPHVGQKLAACQQERVTAFLKKNFNQELKPGMTLTVTINPADLPLLDPQPSEIFPVFKEKYPDLAAQHKHLFTPENETVLQDLKDIFLLWHMSGMRNKSARLKEFVEHNEPWQHPFDPLTGSFNALYACSLIMGTAGQTNNDKTTAFYSVYYTLLSDYMARSIQAFKKLIDKVPDSEAQKRMTAVYDFFKNIHAEEQDVLPPVQRRLLFSNLFSQTYAILTHNFEKTSDQAQLVSWFTRHVNGFKLECDQKTTYPTCLEQNIQEDAPLDYDFDDFVKAYRVWENLVERETQENPLLTSEEAHISALARAHPVEVLFLTGLISRKNRNRMLVTGENLFFKNNDETNQIPPVPQIFGTLLNEENHYVPLKNTWPKSISLLKEAAGLFLRLKQEEDKINLSTTLPFADFPKTKNTVEIRQAALKEMIRLTHTLGHKHLIQKELGEQITELYLDAVDEVQKDGLRQDDPLHQERVLLMTGAIKALAPDKPALPDEKKSLQKIITVTHLKLKQKVLKEMPERHEKIMKAFETGLKKLTKSLSHAPKKNKKISHNQGYSR